MTAKPIAVLVLACLATTACQQRETSTPAPSPTPVATVTVAVPVPVASPTPEPVHTKGIRPTPDPMLCGADKLGPYLNLLPTSTAKGEIARTVGHNRVRYVIPTDVPSEEFKPDRVTAELGVDGRIKLFRCG